MPSTDPPEPHNRRLLLEQRPGLIWEGTGVMCPGVARLPDDSIVMVYRGAGSNNVGHIGLCRLDRDAQAVLAGSRPRRPINHRTAPERRDFPGGYGDPRLCQVGQDYYIFANGRNNEQQARNRARYDNDFTHPYVGGRQTVAFRTRDFSRLDYLGLYGPDFYDKNSFLHPEPITIQHTSYWPFFHRYQYYIQVALVRSITDLSSRRFWRQHMAAIQTHAFMRPQYDWEGVGSAPGWPGSIAGGSPPLVVPPDLLGPSFDAARPHWLMFYNGSGAPRPGRIPRDRRVGAVLFTLKPDLTDLAQPFEIVARTPRPLLTPAADYEFGTPNGDVVFATAALWTLDHQAVDVFYSSGDIKISAARFATADLMAYLQSVATLTV